MTSIAVSQRAETSFLPFALIAIKKSFHRRHMHALRRKELLGLDNHLLLMGLDRHLLLDLGMERMNAMCSKF
jgi:hypothetical protein